MHFLNCILHLRRFLWAVVLNVVLRNLCIKKFSLSYQRLTNRNQVKTWMAESDIKRIHRFLLILILLPISCLHLLSLFQWLPEKEKYLPPMTIHVKDNRAFGRQVLCGTHIIDTLHRYFVDETLFEPRRPPEPEGTIYL